MYMYCLQTEKGDFRLDWSTTASDSAVFVIIEVHPQNSHGRSFIVSNTFVAQESYQ